MYFLKNYRNWYHIGFFWFLHKEGCWKIIYLDCTDFFSSELIFRHQLLISKLKNFKSYNKFRWKTHFFHIASEGLCIGSFYLYDLGMCSEIKFYIYKLRWDCLKCSQNSYCEGLALVPLVCWWPQLLYVQRVLLTLLLCLTEFTDEKKLMKDKLVLVQDGILPWALNKSDFKSKVQLKKKVKFNLHAIFDVTGLLAHVLKKNQGFTFNDYQATYLVLLR